MHREHPIPDTPAAKAPTVDKFITKYLKGNFLQKDNVDLSKVQSTLLKVCGQLACMWAELINNSLLSNPDATVNMHDVLNVAQ